MPPLRAPWKGTGHRQRQDPNVRPLQIGQARSVGPKAADMWNESITLQKPGRLNQLALRAPHPQLAHQEEDLHRCWGRKGHEKGRMVA